MPLDTNTPAHPKKSRGHIYLALFGLFFLLPGLFIGAMPVSMIYKSLRASTWTNAPAQVIAHDLKRSTTSEGGTTYRATGQYTYDWDGQSYISESLYYSPGYDSGKKFHRAIISKLKSAKSRGNLMVKVNPKKPGQAVAFPAIRWSHIGFLSVFSLLFGGVGGGIVAMSFFGKKSDRRENERKIRYPNAPWLWRDIWQTSDVKSGSKMAFVTIFCFTLFWNLISWPLMFPLSEAIRDEGVYWLCIFLLFPVIGLFMVRMTWRGYLQWKRFGRSYYRLETYPAAPGSAHIGELHIPGHPPMDLNFEIKLTCFRKEERGSGDDRRTVEVMLWQDEQIIPASAGTSMSVFALPVRFDLPPDARTSSLDPHAEHAILWKISAKAEHGSVTFDQDFEIPVFDPQDFPFSIRAKARSKESRQQIDYQYKGDWEKTGVIHSESGDGGYYYFPPARHKGTAMIFTLASLILSAVAAAPFFYSDFPVSLSVVFGFFACIFILLTLHLWLFKSAVEVKNGQMTIRRGLFSGKFNDVGAHEVQRFELGSSMTAGEKKYYDIVAHLTSGKKLKLADNLLGKRDAEALMKRIWQDLGKLA